MLLLRLVSNAQCRMNWKQSIGSAPGKLVYLLTSIYAPLDAAGARPSGKFETLGKSTEQSSLEQPRWFDWELAGLPVPKT